jgi:hypothetical protein
MFGDRQVGAIWVLMRTGIARPAQDGESISLSLFSLFDSVEPIRSQMGPDFHFSVRPKDLNSIDVVLEAETEVNTEIMLGKITSTT